MSNDQHQINEIILDQLSELRTSIQKLDEKMDRKFDEMQKEQIKTDKELLVSTLKQRAMIAFIALISGASGHWLLELFL